ncbi:MAG: hypothetical protein H0U81_08735 [Pyrinomonadaceae bacterium]|nr:hypothetical protein [Pyrinomonadaceae bacterium]
MFDWQTGTVALIILAALAYVSRRGWARLRSFTATGSSNTSSCASGCGSCGGERQVIATSPGNILVRISRSSSNERRV